MYCVCIIYIYISADAAARPEAAQRFNGPLGGADRSRPEAAQRFIGLRKAPMALQRASMPSDRSGETG